MAAYIPLILSFAICGMANFQALAYDRGCPDRVFLGCILRLRAQRVPFNKNFLNVVFNITSEAKLLHTCKAYGDVMPCFRDQIVECGNEKQKRMLNEVGKMLMFLCSPFSMQRQRQFMAHGRCIGQILRLPATAGCQHDDHPLGNKLQQCKDACGPSGDFICLMKVWISEQHICLIIDIEKKCSVGAVDFYTDLQTTVFEPNFPLICDFEPDPGKTLKPLPTLVADQSQSSQLQDRREHAVTDNVWTSKTTRSSTRATTKMTTRQPITARTFWPSAEESFHTRFDPWTLEQKKNLALPPKPLVDGFNRQNVLFPRSEQFFSDPIPISSGPIPVKEVYHTLPPLVTTTSSKTPPMIQNLPFTMNFPKQPSSAQTNWPRFIANSTTEAPPNRTTKSAREIILNAWKPWYLQSLVRFHKQAKSRT